MSNLGQGYWERWRVGGTHTRDTGEKEKKMSLHTAASFSLVFVLRVAAKQTMIYEFKRVQIGGLCEEWCLFCHLTFFSAQISPQPLYLSQTFKHLLKGQKISYLMHVSGHRTVEWVQRYACAKLSETIWLAGG